MKERMAEGKKHYIEELREMVVEQKKKGQPVDEILAVFCERHSLSLDECQKYYDALVAQGVIKPKESARKQR